MHLIEREQCAITGANDLEPLYEFPNFPVFMGCLNQPEIMDLKESMSWWISRSSGVIQLKNLIPLDVLYPESHGAGAVGALWENHHQAFADFIHKAAPTSILEIGGAHGILERNYQQFGQIPWTILEPNPSPVEGCKAKFIKGFFDENFKYSDTFDTIVHSHVFEHIYKPIDFMKHLSGFMLNGNNLIFSIPNMQVMLERKYTNCVNFEHTIFLTEPYIEYLMAKNGFKLQTKEYFLEDHSIFYSFVRDDSVELVCLPEGLYEFNKKLYLEYIKYHIKLISSINEKISNSTKSIYLFGAHVFAQYLIEMGLNTEKIICLLDNDKGKQGKRLYGTNLKVAAPDILAKINNPIVILKAGVYDSEIKSSILERINKDTEFYI